MLTLITEDARNYKSVYEGTRMEASLAPKFDLPFSIQHNFTHEGVIIDIISHETGEVVATSSEGWDEVLERMYPDFIHDLDDDADLDEDINSLAEAWSYPQEYGSDDNETE